MSVDLFSPLKLGALELPNRIVMAPMTRCRATADHVPTPLMAEYYAQRADAGLLITEGTGPDANGTGYARIPGLYSDAQVRAWSKVTEAVHHKGGRIAVQLMHGGRVGHPLNLEAGAELLAPSAVALSGEMYTDQEGMKAYPTPRAMTADEVEAAIDGYVHASKNAMAAGFDLVELHGANGYLIEQFFDPAINLRADKWGGDVEGRGRFAVEVARRVSAAIGADRVGVRLSPLGVFNGVTPWASAAADYTWLAGKLGELGLAYLHAIDHSSMGAPPVPASLKAAMKKAFGGVVILAGGFDKDQANAALAEGRGELVAYGRPYLANPDLVTRLDRGAELNAPDFGSFYTPGPKGYTDYPVLANLD